MPPSGAVTRPRPNPAGTPVENWTYLVIAVDGSGQELVRTNRIGEHDYTLP